MSQEFDPQSFAPAYAGQSAPGYSEEILSQRLRAQVRQNLGTQLKGAGDSITDNDLRQKLDMPLLDANGQPIIMVGSAFSHLVQSAGKVFLHELFEGCAAAAAEYCVHHAKEHLIPNKKAEASNQKTPPSVESMVAEISKAHNISLSPEQHQQLVDIFTKNMQAAIQQSLMQVGQAQQTGGFVNQIQASPAGTNLRQ